MRLPRSPAFALLLAAVLAACAHRGGAPATASAEPAWHRGAVVYGVVPPLFGDPPLRAVTARLDALAALGVDLLWLAPVTETDDRGAISYSVTDYWRVREDFGTPDDLRTLVREAHARGMRVLLDFVPNHTSTGHPFYRDAEARGRASPWWSFYERDASGEARWDFDWKHLRQLELDNPAVRRMLADAFAYWVREYDVDGFRVDAAWGLRDRRPDFWPAVVADLRRQKPDLVLVAEASARERYWVESGFDAAYDWTAELGRWAFEHVFDDPGRIGPAIDAALASDATPMDRVFRFLDNNDTGERFVTEHGVPFTRVAATLVHTLPGLPVVYTGEEVGAEYEPYEDPPVVAWTDPHGLLPHYRRLATLRESLPALRDGGYRRVRVVGNDAAFAFVRDAGSAGQALVVLNFGPAARLRLEPGEPLREAPGWDALADRAFPVDAAGASAIEVELEATSAVVL
ncbi:MAG TPA: alpha-amylase family glycosyl hydrolase, partial [Anaeromyxobacteraceae bacterium]|nr:alpha-amylase family glycosyl hydrolase [Anaeromyxobacteraceae bacterium]